MKPTKMRNQQFFRASLSTISKQLVSSLSKELRKKYGKRNTRIVLGDTVRVFRGEYKGIDGKITKTSTEKNSVAIEGIKKEKIKGEKFDVLIHTSNVIITSLNTDDKWRNKKLHVLKEDIIKDESKSESPKKAKSESPKKAKSESPKKAKSESPKKAKSESPKKS